MILLADINDALTFLSDDRKFMVYFEKGLFNNDISITITTRNKDGIVHIEDTNLTLADIKQDPLHCIKEFLFKGNKKRYHKIFYINKDLTAYLINDKIYINDTEII
jgi:hypothetical protein